MRLKENVETVIQLINNPNCSRMIMTEDGNGISKDSIEHFVILHVNDTVYFDQQMAAATIKRTTRKRATAAVKPKEEDPISVEERVLQREVEDEEDEGLNKGESSVFMSDDDILQLIRRQRKINCQSMVELADNNWFICPVYIGMRELNPIVVKRLPRGRGYQLNMVTASLANVDENEFTKENLKEWELNSIRKFDQIFDKDNPHGIRALGQFIHRKESNEFRRFRLSINRYDIISKTRIKLGNILVNEVNSTVGQDAYISNKENIAKKSGAKQEVSEYDLENVKIIKFIESAYKRINQTAEEHEISKVTPIRIESQFLKTLKIIKDEEEKAHQDRAEEWLDNFADSIEMQETWRNQWIARKKIELEGMGLSKAEMEKELIPPEEPDFEEAMLQTKMLSASDYIPTFITYMNVQGYMSEVKLEKDALYVVNKLVHDTYLWKYFEGIKGCGELTAAYIYSSFDFRSSVHPSSLIRYLGLDNVPNVPVRRPESIPTEEELTKINSLVRRNINLIQDKAEEAAVAGTDQICKNTFHLYATEVIQDWNSYQAALGAFSKPELKDMDWNTIEEKLPSYYKLVDHIWRNFEVVEYQNSLNEWVPAVKKHARSKSDMVVTTFLNKNGEIKTKKTLGYNTKMKARIVQICWDSLSKAKNEYYYGELYMNFKKREVQKAIAAGRDPEKEKKHIHLKARRATMQIFVENLWMWARVALGYSTNGGTYYEAKLKGKHGYGLAPDSPLNK